MTAKHYHVNVFSGDGTGVADVDYVYRYKSDAEDALANARMRSGRADARFSPEDVEREEVRECDLRICIEGDTDA